jgi:LDH2 family malate/lactate/ureidoglycolate dehydrogenase
MSAAQVSVPASRLTEAAARLLSAAGLGESPAEVVAGSLVDADMRGVSSHGVMLVPMYVERLRAGSVSPHTEAKLVADSGTLALLDGDNMFGQLSGDQAMSLAIEKAGRHGVGAVVVRHAFHFGGAFRYVMQAADAGCIGVAAANTRPLMPAPGGTAAVVGNNPIAFGIPFAGGDPLVLDMALSEVSLGKIRLAAQEGREIPPTWATDADGVATTNAEAAVDGLLLPAGGHKGYGLALVVDVLTGVLSGGGYGAHVKGLYADTAVPNDCAHAFLALDIAALGDGDDFAGRLADLVGQVTSSPRAPGVERVLMPGQLEAERFAAARSNGVLVDPGVLDRLHATAAELEVVLTEMETPA